MWAFRARDGLATAVHGMWGSFWIAYGILNWLVLDGKLAPLGKATVANTSFAFWFIMLCIITFSGAVASMAESFGLSLVLWPLSAGSGLVAAAYWIGSHTVLVAGGWVLVGSAGAAWYVATAMMMLHASGRTILPLGKYRKAANVPGGRPTFPIQFELGEPGVKQGQ
jgi:succinate-acetate transporter protein